MSEAPRSLWPSVAVLFAAAALLVFSPFLERPYLPRLLGMPDLWKQSGPFISFADHALHQGEFPLWNPLYFCGQPFAGHPLVNLAYPPNLLRGLVTVDPTPYRTHVGLAVLVALHTVLAGVAAFFFARANRLSVAGSFVAGIGYCFSASFLRRSIAHPGMVWMVAWLPLILILLQRALESPTLRQRVRHGLAAGLLFGLGTLAGQPQVAIYMAVAVAAYAAVHRLLHPHGVDGELRAGRTRTILLDAAVLLAVFGAGTLVASSELLPLQEFTAWSGRQPGSALPEERGLSPWEIVRGLVVYPGPRDLRFNYRAAGVGVLLLAAAAAFHPRRRTVLVHLFTFAVLLDCAVGRPLPVSTILSRLAPYEMVHPDRAFLVACLPLAILAGLGVDGATEFAAPRRRRLRGLVLLVVGLTLIALLVRWTTDSAAPRFALVAPLVLLAAIVAAPWLPGSRRLRVVFPALVFLEVWAWSGAVLPQWMRFQGYPGSLAALYQPQTRTLENRRGVDPAPNAATYTLTPIINGYDPLHIDGVRRLIAAPDEALRYRRQIEAREVLERNPRGNLFLKRVFWLARQAVDAPLPERARLFPPTTTVYLPGARDVGVPRVEPGEVAAHGVSSEAERLPLDLGGRVHGDASGRIELQLGPFETGGVHSTLNVRYRSRGPAEVSSIVADSTTNLRQPGGRLSLPSSAGHEATFEIPLPDLARPGVGLSVVTSPAAAFEILEAYVLRDLADEDHRIEITSYRANRVALELRDLPGRRVLAFIDADYPGWRAYVDGTRVAIHRANDGFKAISLPAGSHRVVFAFRPWRASAGLILSLASMLSIAGFMLWDGLRERRRARPARSRVGL